MFQLNKKKIIIIIIIWIILLGITTTIAILFNKNNDSKDNYIYNPPKKNISNDYNNTDYYSFYDENDIKIEELIIDNNFTYIKISGLKDKKIENKINDELYNYVLNEKNNKANNVYQRMTLNAFNILSIDTNSYYEADDTIKTKGFNYDLTTGNIINFEDLFTTTANVSSILYKGFYNKESTDISARLLRLEKEIKAVEMYNETGQKSQYYVEKTLEELNDEKNENEEKLKNIEEIALKEYKNYEKKKDKEFYLTNYSIELFYNNNEVVTLSSRSNMSFLALYEKFKTKTSIFESDKIGKKNLFMSSYVNNYIKYNNVYYIDDYALIDHENERTVEDLELNYINNIIKEYTSKLDKNKFTYLNINNDYHEASKDNLNKNLGTIYTRIVTCTMSKEYFKTEYIKDLFISKEQEVLGFYNEYYNDENNNNFSCKEDVKTSVIDFNNKIYNNLDDIFIDNFDYKSYLIKKYYERQEDYFDIIKDTYTEEEKQEFKIELHGNNIIIEKKGAEINSYYADIIDIEQEYLNLNID